MDLKKLVIVVFLLPLGFFFGYRFCEKRSCCEIPLVLNPLNQPLVPVCIQGREYLLDISVSTRAGLKIRKDLVAPLQKESLGAQHVLEGDGTFSEYPAYQLKEVQIGNHRFHDVIVLEEDATSIKALITQTEDSIQNLERVIFGSVGNELLSQMSFLLDVSNLKMILSEKKSELEKRGYDLKNWIRIPYEQSRFGPIVTMETDWGNIRFSLQTGASRSVVRRSKILPSSLEEGELVTTRQLKAKEYDFGEMSFEAIDLTPSFSEIEGALSLDFFRQRPFYIDLSEKAIYIKKDAQ